MFVRFNPKRHTRDAFGGNLFYVVKQATGFTVRWMCKGDSGKVIRKTYSTHTPPELLSDGDLCVRCMKLYNGKWVFDKEHSKTKEQCLKERESPVWKWLTDLERLYHDSTKDIDIPRTLLP